MLAMNDNIEKWDMSPDDLIACNNLLAIARGLHEAYEGCQVGQDRIQDYTGELCDVLNNLEYVLEKFYD